MNLQHAVVINHLDNIVRLYDGTKNSPNELNIARDNQGNVAVGMNDAADVELWITVSEDELLAALAVSKVNTLSQD